MEKQRIRVGIVGLGSQGASYVRNRQLYEDVFELCAIADISEEKVHQFGTEHGVPESGWYYSQRLKSLQIKDPNPKNDYEVLISFEQFDLIGM